MITKITNINFGIFKDFNWDEELGSNTKFEKINIIYGRNYSGKTTLSRIVRALETKSISEKYENPKFKLEFDNGNLITQDNCVSNNLPIRVFNEDFVRENLSFPYNDDGNIKSFALLGKQNVEIQNEIDNITKELGNEDDDKLTGKYKERKEKQDLFNEDKNSYDNAYNDLQSKLTNGARAIGNGSRSYNKNNLSNDIKIVLEKKYKHIDDIAVQKLNNLLNEKQKETIDCYSKLNFDFQNLSSQVKSVVEKKVGNSEKIEELVKNAELNRWVEQGKEIQKGRSVCAFCGNKISDERWKALDKHFDEEYQKLDKSITDKQILIDSERIRIEKIFEIEKDNFYSSFENAVNELLVTADSLKKKIDTCFNSLKSQLEKKQKSMLEDVKFICPDDFSAEIDSFIDSLNSLINENNEYSKQLAEKQNEVKQQLRLHEVYKYCETVEYNKLVQNLSSLEKKKNETKTELDSIEKSISEKEYRIQELKSQMSNEKEGAKKINDYLSRFFDTNHLVLDVIDINDSTDEKQNRFSIIRNGERAFNLSEGECRIIALCYFMAKLNEVLDSRPIIWIDDPICSLDDNHIFSVYSALYSNLIKKISEPNGTEKMINIYEQIFISTHSLNFLKYLKRFKGEENQNKQYFIIQRRDKKSYIKKMPKYMQEYATEFNYLFKQIFKCSEIDEITDENYSLFYNFGNNARKFLEIYSYYKFPDMYNQKNPSAAEEKRLKKLWGENTFEAILSGRLNNEYSHLAGSIERGEQIVDVPEIKKVAISICEKLKKIDEEQYNALVNSIV